MAVGCSGSEDGHSACEEASSSGRSTEEEEYSWGQVPFCIRNAVLLSVIPDYRVPRPLCLLLCLTCGSDGRSALQSSQSGAAFRVVALGPPQCVTLPHAIFVLHLCFAHLFRLFFQTSFKHRACWRVFYRSFSEA